MTSITARWLKVEQLLKQKSIQHQQNERLKIIKDYASEIDILLNQSAILSGSKQKNEQKLARFKVLDFLDLNMKKVNFLNYQNSNRLKLNI